MERLQPDNRWCSSGDFLNVSSASTVWLQDHGLAKANIHRRATAEEAELNDPNMIRDLPPLGTTV